MKPNKITLEQSLLHEMLDYQDGQLVWKNKKHNLAHLNGIKDDNRIENLRLVTAKQNSWNRSRLNAKGYCWNKESKKWQASIFLNGKLKYLGLFSDEQDARNAYLANCKIHHEGIHV